MQQTLQLDKNKSREVDGTYVARGGWECSAANTFVQVLQELCKFCFCIKFLLYLKLNTGFVTFVQHLNGNSMSVITVLAP